MAEAQAEQQLWEAKIKEIQRLKAQGAQGADKESKQNREDLLLQKIKRNKEMINRKAREAIWSEQNQRIYETWELPGEIPNFSFPSFDQGIDGRTSEKIEPPEVLNEELEAKGRQLLRSERAVERAPEITQSTSTKAISSDSLKLTSTDFINHEEELKASIMVESLKQTPENRRRWEARKKIDQLIIEAAEQVIKDRALRMVQADENEEATGNDEIMSRATRVTRSLSNFGSSLHSNTSIWKPKAVSVLGSVTESEHAMALAAKAVQSQKATDKKTQSDLEKANQKVEDAKKEWEEMILSSEIGVEARRIANGGVPPYSSLDTSLLLEFWEKADRQAFQEARKQEKIEKEERIAKKLQEQWKLNTIRWKARAEADLREREAKDAEEKAKNLLEEKLLIDAKSGSTKKEKQEASDAAVVAKKDAEKARTIATQVQETWYELACDHHSVSNLAQQEESTSTTQTGINCVRTLNKLQQADQAVNNLWAEVSTLYDEGERHEDDFLLQEQREKEAAQYSITLLAKRETDIVKCFKGVQQAQQAAKKQYDSSTSHNSRAEAQRLYEEVNRLELSVREAYAQIVETDALTDARKRTPGAMEAWLRRVTDSEGKKSQEANRVVFKTPCKDNWADETKRSLERLEAIEAADKKAFKIFRDEETRLNDIATIWTAIIESKRRILERAVKSYQEDPTTWEMLHSEERGKYNREIRAENDAREDIINANFKEAEELAEKLRQKASTTWNISLNKTAVEKNAKKAEEDLTSMKDAEAERQKALRWPKLTSEERRAELDKDKIESLQLELKSKVAKASEFAKDAHKKAEAARKKADAHETYTYEGRGLKNASISYEHASDAWLKASEASNSGNVDIGIHLTKIAVQFQALAEQLFQIAQNKKRKIGPGLKSVPFAEASMESLVLSIDYMTKGAKANNNHQIATMWKEAAERAQASAGYSSNAAQLYWLENKQEGDLWDKAVLSAKNSIDYLVSSIEYMTKASEAHNKESADIWREAAERAQASANYSNKAAQLHCSENIREEGDLWDKAALSAKSSVDCLVSSIEYMAKGREAHNKESADIWSE
ncbi:MAG TPA: hypothetical protein VJK54_04790, partial [Chthoniobacterales bacterium]|nr:hypothetical protein [Chthoniobacterales bacterium]